MSAISLKSITGITSITTPAGVDNQLTLHTNNTTEAVKLDTAGNLHFHNHLNITGVSTASNFKTGTTNVHNVGVEAAGINVLGADTPIGAGATIFNSGDVVSKAGAEFQGIVTATSFAGSGASLTNLNGSNIASGTVPVARIGTGTKNTSTFYRGDGTFATVTAPAITAINSPSNNRIVTSDGGTTVTGEPNLTFDGAELDVNNSGGSARLYLISGNSADSSIYFGRQNDGATGGIRYEHTDDSLKFMGYNNADKMVIDSSGNVLVGTTDTSVYNNGSGNGIVLRGGQVIDIARSNDLQLTLNRMGNDGPHIAFYKGGGQKSFISTRNNAFCIDVNGTNERLRIQSDGRLVVSTNANTTVSFDYATIHFNSDNSTVAEGLFINNIAANTGDNASISFSTDSGNRKKSAISHVDTGNYGRGDLVFSIDPDADSGELDIVAHEKLRITSDGKVGINATPTQMFEVHTDFGLADNTYNVRTSYRSGNNASGYTASGLHITSNADNNNGEKHTAFLGFSNRDPALNGSHGSNAFIAMSTPDSPSTYGTGQLDFYIRNGAPYAFPNDPQASSSYWMDSLFTIKSNGNIGINQTTPTRARLHVVGGTANPTIVAKFKGSSGTDARTKIGLAAAYSDTANDTEGQAYVGALRGGNGNSSRLFFEVSSGTTLKETARIDESGVIAGGSYRFQNGANDATVMPNSHNIGDVSSNSISYYHNAGIYYVYLTCPTDGNWYTMMTSFNDSASNFRGICGDASSKNSFYWYFNPTSPSYGVNPYGEKWHHGAWNTGSVTFRLDGTHPNWNLQIKCTSYYGTNRTASLRGIMEVYY